MNTIKTLIVLFSIMFAGCAIAPNSSKISKHTIHFSDAASLQDKKEQFEAADMIIESWQAMFQRQSRSTDIFIMMTKYTNHCGDAKTAIGCYRSRPDTIEVVAGKRNSLPALFHELCHSNAISEKYGVDAKHEDERWEEWNFIGDLYSEVIAESRK